MGDEQRVRQDEPEHDEPRHADGDERRPAVAAQAERSPALASPDIAASMDTSLLITRSPPGIPVRLIAGAALAVGGGARRRLGHRRHDRGTDHVGGRDQHRRDASNRSWPDRCHDLASRGSARSSWRAAALLVAVTPRGVITLSIAALAGVGAGLVTPRSAPWRDRWGLAGLAGAARRGRAPPRRGRRHGSRCGG